MDNNTAPKDDLKVATGKRAIARLKRRILANVLLIRIILAAAAALLIFLFVFFLGRPFSESLGSILFWPKMAATFLFGSPGELASRNGRTNILLMGAGGAGHEAPELTDTMIFASLDHRGKNPIFLSLPRDIWISSLRAKINTAYYYGNQKRVGGGLILSKSSVSEILGQPVHYAVAVDFSVFSKIVDTVGGIEVEVDRTFDDYRYPIPGYENDLCGGDPEFGCRYEHIHFEKGKQTMSGETALKFVRSRNAEGEEGTDFSRSVRQQKVIDAIKQNIVSPSVLFNPTKISELWKILNESIDTDIPQENLPVVVRMVVGLDRKRIKSVVLDGGTQGDAQTGLLVNPPITSRYDNQWVLVSRDGTWEEVKLWLGNILK